MPNFTREREYWYYSRGRANSPQYKVSAPFAVAIVARRKRGDFRIYYDMTLYCDLIESRAKSTSERNHMTRTPEGMVTTVISLLARHGLVMHDVDVDGLHHQFLEILNTL